MNLNFEMEINEKNILNNYFKAQETPTGKIMHPQGASQQSLAQYLMGLSSTQSFRLQLLLLCFDFSKFCLSLPIGYWILVTTGYAMTYYSVILWAVPACITIIYAVVLCAPLIIYRNI